MRVGDYKVGVYTTGCIIIGIGLGWAISHLFAGALIGLGVGYILDTILLKSPPFIKIQGNDSEPEEDK